MKRQTHTAASIPRTHAAAATAQRPRFLRKSTASSQASLRYLSFLKF